MNLKNLNELEKTLKRGRVGGAGQAVVDGNKQNCTSHKPCDLNNPAHQTLISRVREKRFPLDSFLSQWKTTLFQKHIDKHVLF